MVIEEVESSEGKVKRSALISTTTDTIPAGVSRNLDVIRALAAMGVVAGHARALFLVPYPRVVNKNPLILAVYAATAVGHQWVMVFFVLSGFLISRSLLTALKDGRWSWRSYLVQRLSRLWIVLIPALILGIVFDVSGGLMSARGSLYHNPAGYEYLLPVVPARHLSGIILLGNALFLQGIRVPTLGSNGALWSLSYEFWFYILFPLCVFAFYRTGASLRRAMSGVLLALLAAFVGRTILLYFLVWLFGFGVLTLRVRVIGRRLRALLVSGLVAGWLLLVALGTIGSRAFLRGTVGDFVVSLGFAGALYGIVKLRSVEGEPRPSPGRALVGRLARMATFSYTLYVVHLPLLVFLKGTLASGPPAWQPGPRTFVAYSAIVILVVVVAWGVSKLTEARTGALRQAVMTRFKITGRARPVSSMDGDDPEMQFPANLGP